MSRSGIEGIDVSCCGTSFGSMSRVTLCVCVWIILEIIEMILCGELEDVRGVPQVICVVCVDLIMRVSRVDFGTSGVIWNDFEGANGEGFLKLRYS